MFSVDTIRWDRRFCHSQFLYHFLNNILWGQVRNTIFLLIFTLIWLKSFDNVPSSPYENMFFISFATIWIRSWADCVKGKANSMSSVENYYRIFRASFQVYHPVYIVKNKDIFEKNIFNPPKWMRLEKQGSWVKVNKITTKKEKKITKDCHLVLKDLYKNINLDIY